MKPLLRLKMLLKSGTNFVQLRWNHGYLIVLKNNFVLGAFFVALKARKGDKYGKR